MDTGKEVRMTKPEISNENVETICRNNISDL
jgi:hypothetical protein